MFWFWISCEFRYVFFPQCYLFKNQFFGNRKPEIVERRGENRRAESINQSLLSVWALVQETETVHANSTRYLLFYNAWYYASSVKVVGLIFMFIEMNHKVWFGLVVTLALTMALCSSHNVICLKISSFVTEDLAESINNFVFVCFLKSQTVPVNLTRHL